ncbi:MAG: hypothetical protein AAF687_12835 [Pseudomonadota bacterium]
MAFKLGALFTIGAAAAVLLSPQQAVAQANTVTPVLICSKAVLHFTPRGFAFECQTQKSANNAILVVRDDNFPGRVDHVIDVLKAHNARNLGTGRARAGQGLAVSFRRADSAAQSVCSAVYKRITLSNGRCLIAADISYQ